MRLVAAAAYQQHLNDHAALECVYAQLRNRLCFAPVLSECQREMSDSKVATASDPLTLAPDAAADVDASAAASAVAEFAELLPPDAEFAVQYSDKGGRFMVCNRTMPAGYDFLIEAPLVAWPLVHEFLDVPAGLGPVWNSKLASWCEGCFCRIGDTGAAADDGTASGDARRVRRRIIKRRPAAKPTISRYGADSMYCTVCGDRAKARPSILTSELLWRWRCWQKDVSPESRVGLEAFARCFAQVAHMAARLREGPQGLAPNHALQAALRPFLRLADPPEGGQVVLYGTSSEAVAAELRGSEPFASSLAECLGDASLAAELLSEATVDALAGRLVLNTAGIEVPGAGPGGGPLRGAGLFMLLSTMNHSCVSTVEAVFNDSSTVTLRTTREVAAGEPLTLAYVPMHWPVAQRRERLKHWFFECDCWLCETESHLQEAIAG